MTASDEQLLSACGSSKNQAKSCEGFNPENFQTLMKRYQYPGEIYSIIQKENLLPIGLLRRLQTCYPQHSNLLENSPFLFRDQENYTGLSGFRQVCEILKSNGINLPNIAEREVFVQVYRFLATRHTLNSINWSDYENDQIYQLVMPQPGMIDKEITKAYIEAESEAERDQIVKGHINNTNPHDGKQLLNKPYFKNAQGKLEVLEGCQHKYPQCMLILDKATQHCFSYCTYCFRHAQVRGDEDMFVQDDIDQVHRYLKVHPEVTDLLITGGDAGFMPVSRLAKYVMPLIDDPTLSHVRTVRLGSRSLTYQPEMILAEDYSKHLDLFDTLYDNGIQVAWMAHFSCPQELLHPSTIAAIRRLKSHGVMIRSQSPILNHISLFKDEGGKVDIEKSAQNWIDLANIQAMLGVGFHSMYCARPTGEHQYFSAPLADIEKIFSRIYRSLASINRPSRYISMTISAGKLALIGTAFIGGEKCFALKFTEARNMEWMDRVILARYDETQTKISLLKPFDSEEFFFDAELTEIENKLTESLQHYLTCHS